MSYSQRITDDLKKAMKERQKEKLEPLRAIKTAFILARSEKKAGTELTEDEELRILQKLVKQRKDSADIYKDQNRDDLYEKEMNEAGVIESYLPEQMSDEELTEQIEKIIDETGAEGMKDMGMVMGKATKDLAGKAEGKKISEIVRKLLT